jgi:hypothetical protein
VVTTPPVWWITSIVSDECAASILLTLKMAAAHPYKTVVDISMVLDDF